MKRMAAILLIGVMLMTTACSKKEGESAAPTGASTDGTAETTGPTGSEETADTGASGSSDGTTATKKSSGGAAGTTKAPATTAATSQKPYSDINFTDADIRAQKAEGRRILNEIRQAARDLSVKEYVVPSGHYGFSLDTDIAGVKSGFVLYEVKRPDNNPFTIKAYDVTFWFDSTGEPSASVGRGLQLVDCENIKILGLTIDGYDKTVIEGKLVSVDQAKNTMEIDLIQDTLRDETRMYRIGSDSRIIALKADGDLISPLYNLNNTWGPEYMWVTKLEKGANADRLKITLRTKGLIATMTDQGWREAYGLDDTLQIGDRISVVHGVLLSICLDTCKQITIQDVNVYNGRGGFWENGGYGAHKWINCKFIPRPGSEENLGGDGNMSQGLRHGSTYDNVTIKLTTDDAFNIHGAWSKVTAVSGSTVTIDHVSKSLLAGDPVEFYDRTGTLVGKCTIKKTPDAPATWASYIENFPLELTGTIPANVKDCTVRWPNSECAGWVIKNCTFDGVYQRILIQAGPGTFENNVVKDMGSNLALTTTLDDAEGGFIRDIVIRNNFFINSTVHPGGSPIQAFFNPNWTGSQSMTNLTITGNTFVGAGDAFFSIDNVSGLTISDNVFINPIRYTALAAPRLKKSSSAFKLTNASGVSIKNNYLFEQKEYTKAAARFTDLASAAQSGNVHKLDAADSMQKAAEELIKKSGTAKSKHEQMLQKAKAFK